MCFQSQGGLGLVVEGMKDDAVRKELRRFVAGRKPPDGLRRQGGLAHAAGAADGDHLAGLEVSGGETASSSSLPTKCSTRNGFCMGRGGFAEALYVTGPEKSGPSCNADIGLRAFHSLSSLVVLRNRPLLIAADLKIPSGSDLHLSGFATAPARIMGSPGKEFINRNW